MKTLTLFNVYPSLDRMLIAADEAVADSPGDELAWLYKTLLSVKAGYLIAGRDSFHSWSKARNAQSPFAGILALLDDENISRLATEDFKRFHQKLSKYGDELSARKTQRFNTELGAFDDIVQSYRRESVSIGEYVRSLFPVPQDSPIPIKHFLEACGLEKALDFRRVEEERKSLLETLTIQLNEEELQNLLAKSMAMRLGAMSLTDYYEDLHKLVTSKAIDLALWPAFQDYCRYTASAKAIDYTGIYGVLCDKERNEYAKRLRNPDEEMLLIESERLFLAAKLLDYLSGKLGIVRLAANEANNPNAMQQLKESLERSLDELEKEPSMKKVPFWKKAALAVKRLIGR